MRKLISTLYSYMPLVNMFALNVLTNAATINNIMRLKCPNRSTRKYCFKVSKVTTQIIFSNMATKS